MVGVLPLFSASILPQPPPPLPSTLLQLELAVIVKKMLSLE